MTLPSLRAYEILQPLGEGGMGQVFKAHDHRLDRVVALKFLSHRLSRDPSARDRFTGEARMAASVEHPNICSIFEIGEDDDGRPFIAMTYCPRPNLAVVLEDGPVSDSHVKDIAIQAGSALQAAHLRGIVHRDVKPSNISFTEDGSLKVLDFGIARLRSGAETTSDIEAGTAAYMAPEQVQGLGADARSDIWALGVVLYECLTGVHPFRAPYDQATIYNILNSDPKPLPETDRDDSIDWQRVVSGCLRRSPADRFQSMDELLEAVTEPASRTGEPSDRDLSDFKFVGNLPASSRHTVGRTEQRERLNRLLAASDSATTTAVVSGQSGIGKTQLVLSALGDVAQDGARVLIGRCAFNEGVLPYHPFVIGLKQAFTGDDFDPGRHLEQLVQHLGGDLHRRIAYLRAFFTSADDSAGVLNREQLWDSVLAFYRALSSKRNPLVIVVDDLQWADEATLGFFSFLVRSVRNDPIRLVGIYRLDAASSRGSATESQLTESIRQLRIEGAVEEMPVGPLSKDESASLVRSLLDDQPVSEDVVTAILSKTAGHPLFISEMVNLVRYEGIVTRDGGVWRFKSPDVEIDVLPQRVQDVIHQRLAMLDTADRELLEVASMEGDRFASETVAACLGWSRIDLLKRLQILESRYRLIHHLESGYRFDHSLIRQTLYDGVLPELRQEYHRIIADVLVEKHGDDVDYSSRIARHMVASGRRREAIPYLLESAARARRVYSLNQALTAYRDLQEIVASETGYDAEGKLQVALGLGDVLYLLGRTEEAFAQFEQAIASARQNGNVQSEFESSRKLALCHRLSGRLDEAMRLAQRALTLAGDLDDPSSTIRALHTVMDVHSSKGEYAEAIERGTEALKLSKETGDLAAQSIGQSNLGFSHWHRGAIRESMEFFLEAQATQRAIGDRPGLATTLNFLALSVWKLGRFEDAIANASESVEIKRQINLQRAVPGSLNILGDVYRDLFQTEKALRFHLESYELASSHGNKGAMCDNLRDIGADYHVQGDVERANDYFQQALALSTDSGIKWYQTRSHIGIAEAALTSDDSETAAHHARIGLALAEEIGARELLVEAKWTLARSAGLESSETLLADAFAEANELGLETLKWQIGVDLASSLEYLGRIDDAQRVRTQAHDTVDAIAGRISDAGLRSGFTGAAPVADLLKTG